MNLKDSCYRFVTLVCLALVLTACGGEPGYLLRWEEGVFHPKETYQNLCADPRVGFDAFNNYQPYPDEPGVSAHEKFFLRSWTNDFYLWYDEVPDRDPSDSETTAEYFNALKTTQTNAAGNPKDNFHFSQDTQTYLTNTVGGTRYGYGMELYFARTAPPREFRVRDVVPGSPADLAGVRRGMLIASIDGADFINGNDLDTLNNGLYPSVLGQPHEFSFLPFGEDTAVTITMATANVTSVPVKAIRVLETDSGGVGYIQFNSHIQPAERGLFDAFNELADAGVGDVVLDLRYNGGGLLAMAAQVSYMVAGAAQTANRTFYRLAFNDKHPDFDPITGAFLHPTPFYSRSLGFSNQLAANSPLPELNLSRVFILTSSGTCSASETIINGLLGIGVEVILIGSKTCGKPYGFYPQGNCGTTYFSIQFTGVNDAGFGEYSEGFTPANSPEQGGIPVPGCWVGDDLSHALGDPQEAMLAAALQYRLDLTCPAIGEALTKPLTHLGSRKPAEEAASSVRLPEALPGLNNTILLPR